MDFSKLNFDVQKILGSSTNHVSQTAHSQGCFLYVSGSYIVFQSPVLDEQIAYVKHKNSNITVIAVSKDQKLLAVAEKGKYPTISVYNIQNLQSLKGGQKNELVWQLKGHKYTIDIVEFSSNGKYILSISNHDGSMFIWEKGQTITKNKITKSINKAIFDHHGDLITVGRGYFKIWKFQAGEIQRKKQDDCWMMEGKVVTFGKKFTTKDFIDIAFYRSNKQKIDEEKDKLVLLTNDGLLCLMQIRYEKIDKWIDLMMQKTTSIEILDGLAFCSGDNALVKVIDLQQLSVKTKFPKPPPTNKQNISKDQTYQYNDNQQFPHCLGIRRAGEYLITIYQNKTIFIWKMESQVRPIRSIITHREKINSVCLLEEISGNITFFSTVGEDNTLRIWHIYRKQYGESHRESIDIAEVIGIKKNIYCRNLTRIIYTDSEHPILKMRMYLKEAIACISGQQFLMYSLDNYELIIHETFEQQNGLKASAIKKNLLSIEVIGDLIYLGWQNGKLRIYKPKDEKLIKLKEMEMEMPIQNLQIFQKDKIIIYGKGKTKCYSFQNQLLMNEYNVECCSASSSYIILAQKKSISFVVLGKSKKINSLSLAHELDEHEHIKLLKNNSWTIVIITNKNKLIVANFSPTVIFSEQLSDVVDDVQVSQAGQILICMQSGSIVIKKMESNSKYHKIEEKVKKWFQHQDMSWMDGSVWASSKNKSSSNIKSKRSIQLQGIENQNSIRISQSNKQQLLNDKSVGLGQYNVPNIVLEYKNEECKKSKFNPSNIVEQANKIYQDMNQLMKNYKKNELINQNKNQISFDQNIEDFPIETVNASKKRRIFGNKQKSEVYAKFNNNLVQSVIQTDKSKQNLSTEQNEKGKGVYRTQQSINFGFSQFMEEKPGEIQNTNLKQQKLAYSQSEKMNSQHSQFTSSLKLLLSGFNEIKDNKEYIHSIIIEHYEEYQKIYQLLDRVIGQQKRKQLKKDIIQRYCTMSTEFLENIEKRF